MVAGFALDRRCFRCALCNDAGFCGDRQFSFGLFAQRGFLSRRAVSICSLPRSGFCLLLGGESRCDGLACRRLDRSAFDCQSCGLAFGRCARLGVFARCCLTIKRRL